MIISRLEIQDAFLIQQQPNIDERGCFSRLYCEKEFHTAGINMIIRQMNFCENKERGTLRGLHFQRGNWAEDKVVTCIRGTIYDVCVDIRVDSPTYLKYCACELSKDNGKMFFIPKGCAHGYVTLSDNCQLLYMMSEFYMPEYASGYRYNDPAFHIDWPVKNNLIISQRDKQLPYIVC